MNRSTLRVNWLLTKIIIPSRVAEELRVGCCVGQTRAKLMFAEFILFKLFLTKTAHRTLTSIISVFSCSLKFFKFLVIGLYVVVIINQTTVTTPLLECPFDGKPQVRNQEKCVGRCSFHTHTSFLLSFTINFARLLLALFEHYC